MTSSVQPVVVWREAPDATAPIVVLLHGRGADEHSIMSLAEHLPSGFTYVAVRAPIAEGGGFAWFENRGIGRPVEASIKANIAWFRSWLDDVTAGRPLALVGFSGGAAFAGGLLLDDPHRFAGAAILYGTLPFDAGVPVTQDRLAGVALFVAQGDADQVIPRELLDRTWDYAVNSSGATLTARRFPNGHGLTEDGVAALAEWLTETLASSATNRSDNA